MLAASMKKALPLLLLVFLVVRPAYASDDDDNFRRDVLLCEDAVGKLAQCCPDFDAKSVDCTYKIETHDSGCDFSTTITIKPGLSEPESKCVLALDCDALRTHVCGRTKNIGAYVNVSRGSPDSPEAWVAPHDHEPVCP
jgi:hypothetical protein